MSLRKNSSNHGVTFDLFYTTIVSWYLGIVSCIGNIGLGTTNTKLFSGWSFNDIQLIIKNQNNFLVSLGFQSIPQVCSFCICLQNVYAILIEQWQIFLQLIFQQPNHSQCHLQNVRCRYLLALENIEFMQNNYIVFLRRWHLLQIRFNFLMSYLKLFGNSYWFQYKDVSNLIMNFKWQILGNYQSSVMKENSMRFDSHVTSKFLGLLKIHEIDSLLRDICIVKKICKINKITILTRIGYSNISCLRFARSLCYHYKMFFSVTMASKLHLGIVS